MAYGIKTGGRTKGVPNKITKEVKGKLQVLIDKTVDELTIANLSVSHKLKLLELALNYTLPKLAHTYNEVDNKQKSFRVEYVGNVGEDIQKND
ncbi:MAG: hypothetical protein P8H91_02195 [Flavobacteriaceae bacterium]|nr:hypothetical protein [Flavobacteriaceae bacterium]